MAKAQHTVTGCIPIDRSVVEAYSALITTNQAATVAEDDRQEAEGQGDYSDTTSYPNTRRAKEAARQAAEAERVINEGSDGPDSEGYSTSRIKKEIDRQTAETQRQTNEGIGATDAECAAGSRRKNESIRQSNEATRQSNEETRQAQEGTPSDAASASGSRWARYKYAENSRDAAYGTAEGEASDEASASGSRWARYNYAEAAREDAYDSAESARNAGMAPLVGYYACETAASTADKTVTASNYTLANGGAIKVKFTHANAAASGVTLNINSQGAKELYYNGAAVSATNTWKDNDVLEVYYDYANERYQAASSATKEDVSLLGQDMNNVVGENMRGLNLSKLNLLTKQYYSSSDNEIHDGDYNLLTGFYKVAVGDVFSCSIGIGTDAKYSVIAFDANKTIIPAKCKANNWYSFYTVDEGVSYLRFCISSSTGNINGFYVRQNPIQSNICLAFSRGTLNFNNTNHRIELSYEFFIKVGGKYYNIPSGNVNYNWNALSSSLVCLYYDYDNSLLKFGYYSERIKYPILASFYGTGTTNETNVVNTVQACCCRFMIDGIPQDTELIHGVFNDYYSQKNAYIEATPAFELLTQNVFGGGGIFNFDLIPTAHSSDNDQYEINLPANTEIKVILHLTDAELENGYALNAYLIDENQTRLKTLSGLQVDVPFVISAASDAKYLAFYIYKITKKGQANVAWYYNLIQEQIDQLANNIPSYFEENVEDVIEKGRVDIANAGVDGDNMIFITDIHWEENTRNSPVIVRHICDNLTVGSVVMGGDVVNGQADQDTARKWFCDVANGLRSPKSRLVSVFGNHDMNANDGGTSFGDCKSFYAYFQKPLDFLAKDCNNECYFYFDNETTNTRYIVLNSKGPGGYELGTAQTTWFENLLDTTPSTMHIVVFIHALIKSQRVEGGTYDGYWEILPNVPGQTAITIIDDAIDAGKKVEYIITGHYHQDYNGVTSKGVPIIMTDCDGKDTIFHGRTPGTLTEQCFDLMTMNYSDNLISCRRVGRGKSRIVHRGVNSVSVGQTLNISNLISITPSSYTAMDEWGYRYLTPTDTGGPQKAYVHNFGSINSSGLFTAAAAGIGLVWAENDDIVEYFTIKVV